MFKSKKDFSERLEAVLDVLKELGTGEFPNWSEELMLLRGYVKKEQHDYFVERVGIFKTPSNVRFMQFYEENKTTYRSLFKDMELLNILSFSKDNETPYFMLHTRFLVPIRSISGLLISATGWAKTDYSSKYMTVPSPYMDSTVDWFGLDLAVENYINGREYVCVVEGIFDCLSLNALGVPTVAVMGSDFKRSKGMMLQSFGRIISIPDNDRVGKRLGMSWSFPKTVCTTVVDMRGKFEFEELDGSIPLKDTDNLSSYMDSDGLVKFFDDLAKDTWRKRYTLVV